MGATAIVGWAEEVAERPGERRSAVPPCLSKTTVESTPSRDRADACRVRFAQRRDELQRAFRLVYQVYRDRGYLAGNETGIRYHPLLGLSDSRTIIAMSPADRLLGTVSLIFDGDNGVPIESAFSAELNGLRDAGRRIAEAVSMAVQGCRKVRSRSVYFALTRFLIQYARFREIDDLVIAVHPNHARFYCKLLGFEPLGSCRAYDAVRGHPAVACRLSLEDFSGSNPVLRKMHLTRPIPIEHFRQPSMRLVDHAFFLRRMQCQHAAEQQTRRLAS